MNHHELVDMYCGLDWGKFSDLDSAYHGTLTTMNGARRDVMSALITSKLKITDLGAEMWARAQWVMGKDFVELPDTFAKITDTAKAARLANKWGRAPEGIKFCSEDFKILRMVGKYPGVSWGWLCKVFDGRRLNALEAASLVNRHGFDERVKWGWYTLSCDAIRLLEDLDGQA